VPSKALACPECGSDETTGWSDNTRYDGIDFPDDEPARPRPSASGVGRLVDLVARLFPMRRAAPEEQVYRAVLRKVHGDRETVERLVEYERQRAPSASRPTLLQNALDRWERDNR